MRTPILFFALLWLQGSLAKEDECQSLAGSPGRDSGGPPVEVNVSSLGRPPGLVLSWVAPEPGGLELALRLTQLSPLGSPEGQPRQAHTNASSFEFRDLVPGSRYLLEVTILRPCGQNATTVLTARTAPSTVCDLQLLSTPGSPSSLGALWGAAPGEHDGYQLHLSHLESQTLAHNVSVPPGTLAYNFSDLLPGSEYALEVTTWAGKLQAKTSIHQWTAPESPDQLELQALGTSALRASWNGSEGAAWLHLLLMDLLGGTNVTAVVRQGVSNHTFLHLSPGTPYELTLNAAAGPHWAEGPNATEWTYPSAPLDLELTPLPPELRACWKAGPGARDGYLLRLTGPVERNTTLGPGALSATFPGPLPAGDYVLELRVLAGPYDAWAQASAWLDGPLPPQSLEVQGRHSPSDLTIGWASAPGQREGYRVTWHREDGQTSLGSLVDLGPDNSTLTLQGLVPGSCYTVSVWAWAGKLSSSIQRAGACTLPASPTNLSLHPASQPSVLRASWSPPPGGRDGFRLRLYHCRPLTLENEATLAPEAQNFSWSQLSPGTEFLVQLTTLRGADESSSANATGWTPPLAPPLINVTSEGPTQLRASWAHAPGGRDGYEVTLYQAGARRGAKAVGAEVDSAGFSALIPGTEYEVEVVSQAGPLHAARVSASNWTFPLTPNELLVSMQSGSVVISLAWASGPLGQGVCHARLSEAGHPSWEQPLALGQAHLLLRDLTPGRNLSLSVLCQAGPLQVSTHPVVLPIEPGPVEDVQCLPEATHLVLNWTMPVGDVGTCLVVAEQLVAGGNPHLIFQTNTSEAALLLPLLTPATSYRLSLTVLGRNGLWSRAVTLVCATSVEAWHPPELVEAPQLEPETGMGVMITRGMFGEDDGNIQWYGVLATTNMSLTKPPQEAINHTWFDHYYRGHDSYLAILLPNPFYPGPWAVPGSWMVPMGTENCGQTQEICNGQLKPGSQYRFSVVAFTRYNSPETIISFSAFSEPRTSVSGTAMSLPVVVGIVAGCVLAICAVLGLLCWRRVKGKRAEKNRFSQELMAYNPRRTHRPIPIHSFRQSYEAKSAHAHQAFFQEFEELKEVGKEQPRLEAEHPANTSKNRYPHVLPYDHSRVRLTQLDGEPHSDYINANFIPGYTHPQEFIATQGPLKKTLEDFWRLVWEQQVHIIVMLTVGMENGRVLCEHYWPADPNPVTHGHITVHLLVEEPEDEWTKREFQLQHVAQQQQRRVKQLQFTTWPDHSIPEAPGSLLAFLELVHEQAHATQGPGPILVHCSAGVGRTGTFVALSRLLQQLEAEQMVDVFNAVYVLRLHRPLMIQTPSQYIFLHSCLLNKILERSSGASEAEKTGSGSWGTPGAFSPLRPSPRSQPISVKNFAQACAKRAANANAGFLKEYELLLQAIKDEAPTPPPGYERDSVVPYDHSQAPFPPEEESPPDQLLEAWLFPGGFSGRDHVVLTGPAGPKELWELVWEHGAHVLVSLCPPDTREEEFWPTETQPIIMDVVTVHWVAESSTAGWPCTLFRVTHGESGKERQVQRLQFPHGEPGRELPATILLPFLAAVGQCCSRDRKRPGTLLSHSSKGVAQLGTFLAMDQLLQQAGAEYTVDVFNVTLQQSQACAHMTPTLEQYIYLYNCLNSALVDGLP
ncbi:receptor-type tyrosine-protein phosphatase V-like isoform X2 [Talpa occidentalis]|nr:receptor-type tyrosine-protein phosphatase V-like isoform X2 [Talpa occidentalis]XP_037351544.1 receptor-type tyrosine-protein phosphatase V-like isoform X2 [Talpa occidentalis]XP_037351546.1 receptor-type tyrosine-protein phosphatase V-like isoform X2 [Talpa occidentalis]XP_037351547.1 receptor-type tyrosine-protein phosphatase V-like isoform X2 [Talpa occidentalis]XP_037351548.1 receptor-type tyrosine-protein phosphatase V-like isoform X2 [Talpa occidentalis]XP_037351550.1 receptor-type t